jgi:Tfp pilus assembly protein PilF
LKVGPNLTPHEEQLEACARLLETDATAAAGQLREFLAASPLNADAYRLLARADRAIADSRPSTDEIRSNVASGVQMRLQHAARALHEDDLETAEIILRRRLLEQPADPYALHLMAQFAAALDFEIEAEGLLRFVLEIAPDFTPARIAFAAGLNKRNRPLEAAEALEPILAREPDNRLAKALKATALGRAGRVEESLRLHEELLTTTPEDPKLWSSYGHFLKTVGRSDEGYRAMRRAVSLAPHNGEAWWTLSNLKTFPLDSTDIAAMRAALERDDINDQDRIHLYFALGKAHEDAGDAAEAFAQYDRANAIRRESLDYPASAITAEISSSIQFFSRRFFEERKGQGAAARDPIFIVGMPRAGSTLVEQILASHPQVEGTGELPDIPTIAKELGRGSSDYFRTLAALDAERFRTLGEDYLRRTRIQRMTTRPFFIDKMPNNWMQIPLIQMLLPNAKIIDARRHPIACGFSNFKQLYVDGHTFSYDLATIGHYYSNYVRFMAHVDAELPGRVHRLVHEQLVDDTEGEIRRMLDYLELPFDAACLRFHETERAVRTPSSEQVRRPISRKSVDEWRAFEPWLGPLKAALGPVLESYPDAPAFQRP